MRDQPPGQPSRSFSRDKRGNATVALALVMATLLVASGLILGAQPAVLASGPSSSTVNDTDAVQEGVEAAFQNSSSSEGGVAETSTESNSRGFRAGCSPGHSSNNQRANGRATTDDLPVQINISLGGNVHDREDRDEDENVHVWEGDREDRGEDNNLHDREDDPDNVGAYEDDSEDDPEQEECLQYDGNNNWTGGAPPAAVTSLQNSLDDADSISPETKTELYDVVRGLAQQQENAGKMTSVTLTEDGINEGQLVQVGANPSEHEITVSGQTFDVVGEKFANANSATLGTSVTSARDVTMSVATVTLPSSQEDALTITADGTSEWTMNLWRNGAVAKVSVDGSTYSVASDTVTLDFAQDEIRKEDGSVAATPTLTFADGIAGAYDVEIQNGQNVYGTFSMLLDGNAGSSTAASMQTQLFAATLEITYQDDKTTYTDTVTVEPTFSSAVPSSETEQSTSSPPSDGDPGQGPIQSPSSGTDPTGCQVSGGSDTWSQAGETTDTYDPTVDMSGTTTTPDWGWTDSSGDIVSEEGSSFWYPANYGDGVLNDGIQNSPGAGGSGADYDSITLGSGSSISSDDSASGDTGGMDAIGDGAAAGMYMPTTNDYLNDAESGSQSTGSASNTGSSDGCQTGDTMTEQPDNTCESTAPDVFIGDGPLYGGGYGQIGSSPQDNNELEVEGTDTEDITAIGGTDCGSSSDSTDSSSGSDTNTDSESSDNMESGNGDPTPTPPSDINLGNGGTDMGNIDNPTDTGSSSDSTGSSSDSTGSSSDSTDSGSSDSSDESESTDASSGDQTGFGDTFW